MRRKDIDNLINGRESPEAQFLESAKIYHARNTKVFQLNNGKKFIKLKPLWGQSWVEKEGGKELLVVPTRENRVANRDIQVRRLFIFSLSKSKTINGGEIIEFIGRKYSVTSNLTKLIRSIDGDQIPGFTGVIIHYDLNYFFKSSDEYKAGTATGKAVRLSKNEAISVKRLRPDALMLSSKSGGRTVASIAGFPTNDDCYYLVTEDEDGIIISVEELWCPDPSEESGSGSGSGSGEGSGSGSGSGDCSNGDCSSNEEYGGNGSGSEHTAVPEFFDYLFDEEVRDCVKDLVADLVVSSKLLSHLRKIFPNQINQPNVGEMIQTVAQDTNFNVKVREMVIPPTTDPFGNVVQRNAYTSVIDGQVVITLHTPYINNATDLAVARTVMHESMHAYFVRGIYLFNEPANSDFRKAHDFLFKPDGTAIPFSNGNHHTIMAAKYIEGMAVMLEQYALSQQMVSPRNDMTLKEYCKDLCWGGLTGTQSWQIANNKDRIEANLDREQSRTSNSTQVKVCE